MDKFVKVSKIVLKIFTVIFAIIGIVATVTIFNLLKTPKELLSAISTYQLIQANYYKNVDENKLVEGISQGMAKSLNDPYSVYYTKSEMAEFNSQLNGTYAGIGMVLGLDKETNLVKSIRIFKGSPAEKAGLLPGDIIVKINGKSAEGMTTDLVATNVKGKAGSKVELVIFRNKKYMNFVVTREIIRVPSVTSKLLKDDILYIEIASFGDTTAQEFKELINNLDKKPKKIILDLRDNGGGLVNQALEIARYLTPGGVILYESGRDENNLIPYTVDGTAFLDVPIAVLVNENTASASEILSGAIQDYKSGTIIGNNTFGKAVVQTVYQLPTGGALKLTTQRYLTPKKRDLSKKGITPDIKVVLTEADYGKIDFSSLPDINNDPQLIKAIEILGK